MRLPVGVGGEDTMPCICVDCKGIFSDMRNSSPETSKTEWERQVRLRLAQLAKKAGSWNQLAKNAGITPSTLQRTREGSALPSLWTLIRICESTNGSPQWVLTGQYPQVDEDVLADVIEVVDRYLAELEKQGRLDPGKITPRKRAKLIAAVYAETVGAESKKPKEGLVKRMVSLLL